MNAQRYEIRNGQDHIASAIGLDNAKQTAKTLGARFALMPDSQWIYQESDNFFILADSENYSRFPDWLILQLRNIREYENRFPLLKRESETAPWRVSYVARPEAPQGKRRNVIDVTRYLSKYYDFPGNVARDMFRRIMGEGLCLFFDDKPETFEEIYHTCVTDYSCMSGTDRQGNENFPNLPHHPARVYGAGDIGIAWLWDSISKQQIGRAIYNKETKAYPRVYGTKEGMESLHVMLKAESFVHDDDALEGCKLLKIEHRGRHIMPYLDGVHSLTDHGAYWRIDSNGEDGDGNKTNGYMNESARYTCDNCGDRMNEDEFNFVQGANWCEHCFNHETFFCEYYEEIFPDSDGSVVVRARNGWRRIWSRDAADNYAFRCEVTEEYFSQDYYAETTARNAAGDTVTVCSEEVPTFYCERSEEDYLADDFEEIEVTTARGTQTWCKESTEGLWVYCKMCDTYYSCDTEGLELCSDGMACPLDGPRVALAWAASLVGCV